MVAETLAERLISTEIASLLITDSFPALANSTAGMAKFDVLRDLIDSNLNRATAVMSVQVGSTAESTVDATPRKIAAWNVDGVAVNMTVDSTTDNDITADVGGTFIIMISVSFSGSSSKSYQLEIFKNGVATGFSADRKLGSGGDVGSISIHGVLTLVATDTVELYQSSTDGGSAMTITEGQMVISRGGP